MNAEKAFVSQIAKIKRRVAVLAAHDLLLNTGLIFVGLQLILLIAAITGLKARGVNNSWYVVSSSISLSVALLISFGRRRNFLAVLIAIDRRLGLQDRLSTAYEYLKSKKGAEFKDLLMQDAAATVSRLNRRQLMPLGFSRRHLTFIILLLAAGALHTVTYPISRFESARPEQKKIEHAAALLHNYAFRQIENKAGPQAGLQAVFASKLQRLGDQMNDRSLTLDQRIGALGDTLKEVEAERKRLTNDIEARLNATGIQGFSVRQLPAAENWRPDQSDKIKELLNSASGSRIPDAVNKDIESLKDLENIAEILSRLVDEAQKDRVEAAESAETADDALHMSQVTGGGDNEQDNPLRSTSDGRLDGSERSSPDGRRGPDSGQRQENDGALGDDKGQREGYSASAGRGKSESEENSSAEIEKSAGPTMADKMASSPVKSWLIHIRALTDPGETRLKEENIRQTYGKAVESILQKENMPLNYREYIKNYFMAIGLTTEESGNELK